MLVGGKVQSGMDVSPGEQVYVGAHATTHGSAFQNTGHGHHARIPQAEIVHDMVNVVVIEVGLDPGEPAGKVVLGSGQPVAGSIKIGAIHPAVVVGGFGVTAVVTELKLAILAGRPACDGARAPAFVLGMDGFTATVPHNRPVRRGSR